MLCEAIGSITFAILMASTSARNGARGFSPTTFIAVPRAVKEASRTSGDVSFMVYKAMKKVEIQKHSDSNKLAWFPNTLKFKTDYSCQSQDHIEVLSSALNISLI